MNDNEPTKRKREAWSTGTPSAPSEIPAVGTEPNIDRIIGDLSVTIGLERDHLAKLFTAPDTEVSDWTLVVQLHAIVETMVNSALLEKIAPPEAAEALVRRPFSARLELLGRMNLIAGNLLRAAKNLSEIRNGIVHDAGGLAFTFTAYVKDGANNKTRCAELMAHWFISDHCCPK